MSDHQERLYALPDCSIQPIDQRAIMLIRVDNGAVALIDARWQHFLDLLRVFRTLRGHAEEIVRRFPDLKDQERALEAGLRQLLPRDIFYPADDLVARIIESPHTAAETSPPLTICIRTCDRPDFLERLLHAFLANEQRFGHHWSIEILEDSRKPESQDANRSLSEVFGRALKLSYIGMDQQAAMLSDLCSIPDIDSDLLGWLLDPGHPDNQTRPSHGRLYNLAFILHAGERILLIDDDCLLKASQHPGAKALPVFQLSNNLRFAFDQTQDPYTLLASYELDPIAAHAQCLSQPIRDVITQLTGTDPTDECIRGCMIDAMPHPYAPIGKIRYTQNGFLGDTGTTSDHNFLLRMRIDDPARVLDPAAYQRLRQSPRCTFIGNDRPTLMGHAHLHHTTCVGIDLTRFTPPVLPRGRSEDALFGALGRFMYPEDLGLHLPFALEHRLSDARQWAFGPEALMAPEDSATALGLWIRSLAAPAELKPTQRLRILQESLLNAEEEGVLEERVQTMLHRQTQEGAALQLSALQAALSAQTIETATGSIAISTDHPWKKELAGLRDVLLRRLQATGLTGNPEETHQHRVDMVTYAKALTAWETAFSARSDRQNQGD